VTRRRTENRPVILIPTKDYWETFLMAQNLIGEISEEVTSEEAQIEVPPDPEFVKFLQMASKWGAPATVAQFKKLPAADKAYYLKAYKIWLENIKKKGIKI